MTSAPEFYEFDRFRLEPDEGQLLNERGEEVKLTPKALAVLLELVRHHGRRVTRNDLQKAVWPDEEAAPHDGSLTFCISQLRKALGDDADRPSFIETATKGYRFIKEVKASSEAAESPRPPAAGSSAAEAPDDSAAFRSFFGEHVFKSDVRLVFAYRRLRPDVPGNPFLTHHPTPRDEGVDALPEGVRSWVAFQDIHAAVYMTNVLFSMKVSGIKVIHDKDIDGDDFDFSAISFGLGFNGFTSHLAG